MAHGAVDPLDLRLADVETFLAVVRLGSINGAARSLRVTASQASKAVRRLERQAGARLLGRGPRGILVEERGQRLLPDLVDLLARARALRSAESPVTIRVVASAFLGTCCIPAIVARLPGLQIQSLETPPGTPSAYAGLPLFDVALTIGRERWPASWFQSPAGVIRMALFASPARARELGSRIPAERLRDAVFVGPIYGDREQIIPGDDGCPLSPGERRFGHRTQTVALALELAAITPQLVFAPVIAARPFVKRGALVEIPVVGAHGKKWNVREQLYLVCHQERVAARVQRIILAALANALRA
jgi:DNA-binding transcriptional LysR family regulator